MSRVSTPSGVVTAPADQRRRSASVAEECVPPEAPANISELAAEEAMPEPVKQYSSVTDSI